MNILDFGCGSGNLAEVLYRNRYKAKEYLGLDIRKNTIKNNKEKFKKVSWIDFKEADLCKSIDDIVIHNNWDIIVCFEVMEHIGKNNAEKLLNNIKRYMNDDTILLLSTPNYDEKVGAAKNHIIDGKIGEFKYMELYRLLNDHFEIIDIFGTFASQKDYKSLLIGTSAGEIFNELKEYYDSNLLSVIFAPLFPSHSRNILWRCKSK